MTPSRRILVALAWACLAFPAAAQEEKREGWFRNITVEKGDTVEDAVCQFCSVIVRGTVTNDVVTTFGGVDIEGVVKGGVVVAGGGVRLLPGSQVEDSLIVVGGPIENASGKPTVTVVNVPWLHLPGQRQVFLYGASVLALFHVACAALAYAVFRRRRVGNMAATLRARPWITLLIGLGATALGITALIYTEDLGDWEDVTAAAMAIVMLLVFLPGFAGLALRWGGRAARSSEAGFVTALAGAGVLSLLMLIPLAGLAVCCLVSCWATGASLASRFGGKAWLGTASG